MKEESWAVAIFYVILAFLIAILIIGIGDFVGFGLRPLQALFN
jgi:Flp pilus assembly pilin Flp